MVGVVQEGVITPLRLVLSRKDASQEVHFSNMRTCSFVVSFQFHFFASKSVFFDKKVIILWDIAIQLECIESPLDEHSEFHL